MIGHDDEVVDRELSSLRVIPKNLNEEQRHLLGLKQRAATGSSGGHEKRARLRPDLFGEEGRDGFDISSLSGSHSG
jgi:hypothetical protein